MPMPMPMPSPSPSSSSSSSPSPSSSSSPSPLSLSLAQAHIPKSLVPSREQQGAGLLVRRPRPAKDGRPPALQRRLAQRAVGPCLEVHAAEAALLGLDALGKKGGGGGGSE